MEATELIHETDVLLLSEIPKRLDFRQVIVDETSKKVSTWLAYHMNERKLGKPDPSHVEAIREIAERACWEAIERIESGESK